MAKLAIIPPHENLIDTMRSMLRIAHMEQALVLPYDEDNSKIPFLVEQAQRQGADIILTRGLIAQRVRQCSNIPVVEMRVTAQELGILLQKSKALTSNSPPTIALVGTTNMFCDYSRLSELFQVELNSYLMASDDPDAYEGLAAQAMIAAHDRPDVIIGGTTACVIARKHEIPAVFLAATPDSIQEGLRNVRRVAYALDQEKNNASEMQTMLDSSFSLLIRFNREGHITTVNRAAISRLDWKTHDIFGKPILSLVKGISQQQLQQILFTGKTLYSVFITIGSEQFVANLMPIRTAEGNIVGGVMSCDDVQRIETVGADIRREQRRLQHPALCSFDEVQAKDAKMQHLVETAGRFAQSDSPVLIRCGPGSKPRFWAECIHNAGERREMPFVSVSCGELTPEEQLAILFGSARANRPVARSMCALAHMGTLYLEDPERLCSQAQGRLRRLLTQKAVLNDENTTPYPLDVRVITSSEADVEAWTSALDPSLNILLSGLTLELPPLRELPGELEWLFQKYLDRYLKQYQRHLSVTTAANIWLREQGWPGNHMQLDRFCELLVLSAPKRSVDVSLLAPLYQKTVCLYPAQPAEPAPPADNYLPPEALRIHAALMHNLGNRKAAARELGISTSTLWRKINKYSLDPSALKKRTADTPQ